MKKAIYSLIQFVPNLSRGEGVNVGVVVVSPDEGKVGVRFAVNNELVKKRFGMSAYDEDHLAFAKKSMRARLEAITPTREGLFEFSRREGNNLVLQAPRVISTESVADALQTLFVRLVGEREAVHRPRLGKPDLSALSRLQDYAAIKADVDLEVPVLRQHLHADFAFKNGVMNYIIGVGFPTGEQRSMKEATHYASCGVLLAKAKAHPTATVKEPGRLIIIGEFVDDKQRAKARGIFDEVGNGAAELLASNDVDGLAEHIKATAH